MSRVPFQTKVICCAAIRLRNIASSEVVSFSMRLAASVLAAFVSVTFNIHAQTLARVQISQPAAGKPVPTDFLGLSIELSSVSRFFGSTPASDNAVLLTLIRNLGQGTLRIGGNSQDEYCWSGAIAPPDPSLCTNTTSLNLNLFESLFRTSAATGWPLLMGLNLAQASSPGSGNWMLDEVTHGIIPAQQAEGGSLLGLELGNEIDLFVEQHYRTSYTPADQAADVLTFVDALKSDNAAAGFLRAAPAYSNYTLSKLQPTLPPFLSDTLAREPENLGLVTIHAYPTNVCTAGSTVTAAQLLAPNNIGKVQDGFTYALSQVQPYGLDLQMGETNSTACSGQNGVSNSQAAALWGLDHMLNAARVGVRRMNFHMGGTSFYNAIQTSSSSGFANQVQPLYYAMYLFQAAKGQSFLPVAIQTNANISAYALAACAGCPVYVYLINKDLAASGTVSVTAPASAGDASMLQLSAPSVASLASDVTYGGMQFSNATGMLSGQPRTTTISPDSNGVYAVPLDNAAAVLLTIPQSRTGPASLIGTVSSRSGALNDRTWGITFTNEGAGAADQTYVTGLSLVQKFGAACTPTPVSFPALPASVGVVAPGASSTFPVSWNFSMCPANARFSLTFSYSANHGVDTGSATLNNLFQ